MRQTLKNWLLARKLNKAVRSSAVGGATRHPSQIVRQKHSRYKLGSCNIISFGDDKVSRDASLTHLKLNAEAKSRAYNDKAEDLAAASILSSDSIEMPDEFVPPPTRVEVKNVILIDGEAVPSPSSLPNKNVHDKLKRIREEDK